MHPPSRRQASPLKFSLPIARNPSRCAALLAVWRSVVGFRKEFRPNCTKLCQKEALITAKKHFTTKEAYEIGNKLNIDWNRFAVEQFRMGLDVELEHGLNDPTTDVTGNDPILTGKIALAHLNEFADYYTRLQKMEREAEEELAQALST